MDCRILAFVLLASTPVWAQSGNPKPANAQPASGPPIAYETASLPKDRVQAWEMLRAATGLGGHLPQPWCLRAHFKTYDPYGKPKADGVLEYVRGEGHMWHSTFTEGTTVFSRWGTDKGVYSIKGQPASQPYPANLILGQYLYPLGNAEADKAAPAFLTKEKFGSTTISCFTSARPSSPSAKIDTDLKRACTAQDKPLLLFRQGSYDIFFDGPLAFQNRIITKRILIKFGPEAVAEVNLDLLRTATAEDLKTLDPPPEAELEPEVPEVLPQSVVAARNIKREPPLYPIFAKQQRIQGTVKLAAVIGTDGTVINLDLLESPDVKLTRAAEDAVEHWTYTPFMVNGKAVEVHTNMTVTFVLGR